MRSRLLLTAGLAAVSAACSATVETCERLPGGFAATAAGDDRTTRAAAARRAARRSLHVRAEAGRVAVPGVPPSRRRGRVAVPATQAPDRVLPRGHRRRARAGPAGDGAGWR